mmetsp:Transcript_25467/g.28339  ORF Transcript_25467/g.28339 Transcript_25467/m.28339 type:complete len:136 (-) Transcript_25467:223-630(-)
MMQFCLECNDILYPREDKENRRLVLWCRNIDACGENYTQDAETNVVYRTTVKEETESKKSMVAWGAIASDPTLARSRRDPCASCGQNEAVFYPIQGSSGVTLYLVCTNCAHHWQVKHTLNPNETATVRSHTPGQE